MKNKFTSSGMMELESHNGQYPHSDFLVAMIKSIPKYHAMTDLKLLSAMRIGISQTYCDSFLVHQTVQEMWLLFYMKVRYKKRWNEQKGEWIDV